MFNVDIEYNISYFYSVLSGYFMKRIINDEGINLLPEGYSLWGLKSQEESNGNTFPKIPILLETGSGQGRTNIPGTNSIR